MVVRKAWYITLFFYVPFIQAKMLQKEYIPGQTSKLQLVAVENATTSLEFKIFPDTEASAGLVTPLSTLVFSEVNHTKPLEFKSISPISIVCTKGSYLPVYIKDEGPVSGLAPSGYLGPYYISMWLPYPYVPESSKIHIRYAVKLGKVGKVGVKIGSKGDYRLVAIEDVKFLSDETTKVTS